MRVLRRTPLSDDQAVFASRVGEQRARSRLFSDVDRERAGRARLQLGCEASDRVAAVRVDRRVLDARRVDVPGA